MAYHSRHYYDNLRSPSPATPIGGRIGTPPPPSETFYSDIYGTAKKPKSFRQWVEAAQVHTKELLEHGSTSPLVWVLVHGKGIPPNAILAGEEHRQPLYIARTFYEVSITLHLYTHRVNCLRRVEYVSRG
jgi:hypothetical protein